MKSLAFWEDPFGMLKLMNKERFDDLMRTDVHETEDAAIFEIEIPGYKKEEINISLEDNNLLVVSAKTESKEEEKKDKRVVYCERNSSCSRTFRLPRGVKKEDISAKYEDGVLTVTAKKPALPEKTGGQILIE